ncbi:ribose transport system substrate-binding protein [Burkholderia multivorans]
MNPASRRRFLTAALVAVAAAAVPCMAAHAQEQGPHKPRVALVMKSLENAFFVAMESGAQEYQKHNASQFDLVTSGIRDETDTASQIRIVERMIASKVDAIVLAPADSRALVPVVKKAIDAGIIVVNIDSPLDAGMLRARNLNVPFVGSDNRKGARKVGDFLAKRLKAGDAVGIVEGIPTTTNAQQRTAGFRDAMKAGRIRVVSVQSGAWDTARGNAAAASMLLAYPNLKAILCGNDNMAIGAVSAVRAAGRDGKVYVVGYDNIDAIKPMLKDGRVLATADQYGAKQAVFGIDTALKAVVEYRKQADMSALVETPVDLVTK